MSEQETKTYSARGECQNCGNVESFNIPLGVTIAQYFQHEPCSECGCTRMAHVPKTRFITSNGSWIMDDNIFPKPKIQHHAPIEHRNLKSPT